ncbi:MAG: IclR family transcriptional regulator domain-containing protein [Micromonosporaceae bacterium]
MTQRERSPDYVLSLERGLSVIKAFTPRHPAMTLTQVAERTGLTRPAARRFLLTLESLGYVRQEGRLFSLRPRVLELGHAFLASVHPWDAAFPIMEKLSDSVEENCLAGVLDETDVICVARTTRRLVTVAVYVGGRVPAFASSMGRAILANLGEEELEGFFAAARLKPVTSHTLTDISVLREELAKVREQGWSIVEQELEEGLMSVSVPVYGASQRAVAALNVSAHGNRLTRRDVEERILPPLLECGREVSLIFGSRPDPLREPDQD